MHSMKVGTPMTALMNARIFDEDSSESLHHLANSEVKVKSEPEDYDSNTSLEEGELENSILGDKKVKQEPYTSLTDIKKEVPIKTEIKSEIKRELEESLNSFSESPFNKELFKNFKIEGTPLKAEDDIPGESPDLNLAKRETRKSVKRSVFSRLSPYKRCTDNSVMNDKIDSVKSRLGLREGNEIPNRRVNNRRKEIEEDPVVLERRQKQIDYGKNTIGYDNYLRKVPKNKRSARDPKTPDKFCKYSRRAWDGLIKQWRLKLHQYDDPVDS